MRHTFMHKSVKISEYAFYGQLSGPVQDSVKCNIVL